MRETCYYLEFTNPEMDFHLSIPDQDATNPVGCPRLPIPNWARLTCHQCSHYTLVSANAQFCPPAYDMIDLIEHFSHFISNDPVQLHMWTNSEMYTIRTNLQRALAYLYPAILAGSSCPYAALLSPLKYYGKPFPNLEDFLFYALSFDLVGNYLCGKQNNHTENITSASDKAQNLAIIFHGLLLRIKQSSLSDANANALIKDLQWSYLTLCPKMFFKTKLERFFALQKKKTTYA